MVQGYYSLEEAAQILGMPIDELNRMAQKREIRAFSDRGSLKFRQQDIEEMKRVRQLGSDPEIRLSDPFGKRPEGRSTLDSDEHVVFDDSAFGGPIADEPDATIIGVRGGEGSDSDVRLVVAGDKSGSDSDVRLVPDAGGSKESSSGDVVIGDDIARAPSDSDIRLTFEDSAVPPSKIPPAKEDRTEEIHLADMGSDVKLAPEVDEPSSSGSDTEFNLDEDLQTGFRLEGEEKGVSAFDSDVATPAAKAQAGDADDSESDFTLQLEGEDSGDSDFDLGQSAIPLEGEGKKGKAGSLGDSGIGLGADEVTSDSEFELSLDSGEDSDIFGTDEVPAFKESDSDPKLGAKAGAKPPLEETSDSDFELAIDEEFDLDEESGSEVVAIDEDEEEESPSAAAEEEEDEYDDELTPVGKQKSKAVSSVAAVSVSHAWPGWLVPFLALTTIVLAVVGMMMHELMRNAWSYNTPYTMSGTIIQTVHDLAVSIGLAS